MERKSQLNETTRTMRWMSTVLWLTIAFCACVLRSSEARAQDGKKDNQKLVARLELAAPALSPLLLHGTIPIPKSIYPRADGRSPFIIESHAPGRPLIPAQVAIVSRYPTGEADVVEITAPVELSADERPGSRVLFNVYLEPRGVASAQAPALEPRVAELFTPANKFRIGLRTRDVYGNRYWADFSGDPQGRSFGSERLLESGPYARQRRIYSTLVPVVSPAAQGAPLPHLMGAHAYITERAIDSLVRLDLRVNNGAVAGSRAEQPNESVLGMVYWESLELVVPRGWNVVPEVRDPFFGDPYDEGEVRVFPLVKPLPDGKLHMMGPQAQFERRLVLVPPGEEARAREEHANAGLGFSARGQGLWSWFEASTARYFPRRDVLASVDFVRRAKKSGKAAVRAQDAADLASLREALSTGTKHGWYVESGVIGWAHPWFVKEQGSPGGEAISTFEGHLSAAAASRDGFTYLSLLHRMNVCRQPEAAYDKQGDIVGYHRWLDSEGRIPFDFRTNGGVVMAPFRLPMNWGAPCSEQVREVVRRGVRPHYDVGTPFEKDGKLPDNSGNLMAWRPHDDQHMVRYTKNTKALVWLGNDAMAKDDLLLSAELYHLMRHESPHIPASWSAGVTLRELEKTAAAHPHEGVQVGREDGWGIDAMCAAYSVADDAWRTAHRPWFDRMSQLLSDASLPNGLFQRFINERVLGHTRYAVAQTFEHFFLIHALRCMCESVYRGVDDDRRKMLEQLALKSIDFLMWGAPWAKQLSSWQPAPPAPPLHWQGPRIGIAISLNDNYKTPPFAKDARGPNYLPLDGLGGGVEFFHPWCALSWAQEITDGRAGSGLENKYLRRGMDCGHPHESWRALLDDFAEQAQGSWSDNSANWISYLGKLQSLGLR
jgi:hypothetical protein